MADIIPGIIPLKCPSTESIVQYNDLPYSGLIDNSNRSESIVQYNDLPYSGLIDDITRTEFITYTN